jgi:uncharacterized protein YkwD
MSGISALLTRLRRPAVFSALVGALVIGAPAAIAQASTPRHHHRHGRFRHAHRHARRARQASAPTYCPNADVQATSASVQSMRSAVVCLVNQQRGAHHLPMLRASGLLDSSSQGWTNWMVATGNFTHGADFSGRISNVGFNWQAAGENIATGFSTPRAVVSAWMASAEHCQNILNPTYREVGTGMSPNAVGSWASAPSTWTQDFALSMSESPLSNSWGPERGCPYGG